MIAEHGHTAGRLIVPYTLPPFRPVPHTAFPTFGYTPFFEVVTSDPKLRGVEPPPPSKIQTGYRNGMSCGKQDRIDRKIRDGAVLASGKRFSR